MTTAARWQKRGVLLAPPEQAPWALTHAALPSIGPDPDGAPSLLFSSRDARSRSSILRARLDLAGEAPSVASVDPEPLLTPGELGAFDDSGVTNSCLVVHDGTQHLYYSGWSLGVSVPFYFYIGLAVSTDGGRTFERASRAPVLGRSAVDPFLTASPSILVENGVWRMWYVSAVGWDRAHGEPRHLYHVRYAESDDGVVWRAEGHVALDLAPGEHAIGRPCVVRTTGGYEMWFCARGDVYRVGVARSDDGLTWERTGFPLGLEGEGDAWDAGMTAYPWVLDHDGRRFLLYNGNGYGATGIGCAELGGDLA